MSLLAQSIATVSLLFIFYHFITQANWVQLWFAKRYGTTNGQMTHILAQRFVGFLFFGIIPLIYVIVLNNNSILNVFTFLNPNKTLIWILILTVVVIVINSIAAKSPDNLEMYPQIRRPEWTRTLLALSALTWIAYLVAYEFMFRGFLLHLCLAEANVPTAITINTAIYALVHVPKGYKEAIGAIPLGIGLCLITISTGNIYTAIVVHCALALSNEWFSIKYHPQIYLKLPTSN